MLKRKIHLFLLVIMMLFQNLYTESVFAATEMYIPDFNNKAERCDISRCAPGNTVSTEKYGMVPNISGEKLCGSNRIAVCNYDSEGNFDAANVRDCFCLKLEEDEIPPPEEDMSYSAGACVCKNGVVDNKLSKCLNNTKATCSGRADTSNPYTSETCLCLSLDPDARAAESNTYKEYIDQEIKAQSKYNYWCEGGEDKIKTALGCIPTDINDFTPWIMQIIFGIAGGIAFLLMVYGFVLMATSSGDEKKLQGAKETVTSAITGLLVSIFALFIFKLIAVNILKIPGIN